jgi:AmmeMemoRadiSam system protein A
MLTETDRLDLLRLARLALHARVHRLPGPIATDALGTLAIPCGAFVSIHRSGALRGCLGRLTCDMPLADVVIHLSAVVADSDPRFDPVHPSEIDELDIEISVLTPAREIASVAEIEVGRHGLIVEQGFRRGLLLPQVATEQGWDVERFLEHTCLKAGLAPDAWRRGARLFVFEADVFGEPPSEGGRYQSSRS